MKDVKLLGIAMLAAGLAAGAGWAESGKPPAAAEPAAGKATVEAPVKERGAGHGDKGDWKDAGALGQKLAEKLGLSAEKTEEIKALMQQTRNSMTVLKAERDAAKADLDKLFIAETLDEKAVMAAADKLAQVNAEMTRTLAKGRLAVNATLTPEQRIRLQQLKQDMIARFKERSENRRGQGRERYNRGGEKSEGGAESGGGEL